jgi:hypothetical protein
MLCPHGSDFESTTNGPVLFTTLLKLWIGFNAKKKNFLPNLLFFIAANEYYSPSQYEYEIYCVYLSYSS